MVKKKNTLLKEVQVPNLGTIHRINEKILTSMFPPNTDFSMNDIDLRDAQAEQVRN